MPFWAVLPPISGPMFPLPFESYEEATIDFSLLLLLATGSLEAQTFNRTPPAYWTEEGNDAGREVTLDLFPYGCTTFRIAAFPSRMMPWDMEYREIY